MKKVKELIGGISELQRAVEKASSSKARLSVRFQAVDAKLERIKGLLAEEATATSVDKLLKESNDILKEVDSLNELDLFLKKRFKMLLDFEQKLYPHLKIKRSETANLLENSRKHIASTLKNKNGIASLELPQTSKALSNSLETEVAITKNKTKEAIKHSRKAKKQIKKDGNYRFYMASLGTALSIGNILLSLETFGLTAPVAKVSVVSGAGLVTAAANMEGTQ